MAGKSGWRRLGSKRHFRYVDSGGRRITGEREARTYSRARDPAGMEGRLDRAEDPKAKLQATGHDAAGRKQYVYHADFRARQEQAKYDKLIRFAARLPGVPGGHGRRHRARRPAREKVAAIAVRLINLGWFRVGSDRYAKSSRTFGITTLHKRHVTVRGSRISFRYRGKHAILIHSAVVDAELAAAVKSVAGGSRQPAVQVRAGGRAITTRQSA